MMEKRICRRKGYEYRILFEYLLSFIRMESIRNDLIKKEMVEKIEKLCIGLETGELEIIEFGEHCNF